MTNKTQHTMKEIELVAPAKAKWSAQHLHISAHNTGEIHTSSGNVVRRSTAIADCDTPELAAQIAAEHNSHAALLTALKDIADGMIPTAILNPVLRHFEDTGDKLPFKEAMICWMQERARAALALATGEASGNALQPSRDTLTPESATDRPLISTGQGTSTVNTYEKDI
jgi:hypothetical protein